ncbi:MAG TPA: hypothetical protein VNK43_06450 [Gemmatimonadales bacterium]|nr:hypothetical protein [Gemmatimonadales bacterium]
MSLPPDVCPARDAARRAWELGGRRRRNHALGTLMADKATGAVNPGGC